MYKAIHRLVKQVNVLVSNSAGPYEKVPPERRFAKLYLLLCLHLLIILLRFFKILSCLCTAIANFV